MGAARTRHGNGRVRRSGRGPVKWSTVKASPLGRTSAADWHGLALERAVADRRIGGPRDGEQRGPPG